MINWGKIILAWCQSLYFTNWKHPIWFASSSSTCTQGAARSKSHINEKSPCQWTITMIKCKRLFQGPYLSCNHQEPDIQNGSYLALVSHIYISLLLTAQRWSRHSTIGAHSTTNNLDVETIKVLKACKPTSQFCPNLPINQNRSFV